MSQGEGGGRPPHEPTAKSRQTVESMAGYGVTQEDIGFFLEISDATLRKYYARELRTGKIKANSEVGQSLHQKAVSKTHPQATTAAIWWSKTQMGWKEPRQDIGLSTPDGPLERRDVGFSEIAATLDLAGRTKARGSGGEGEVAEGGETASASTRH